VKARRFNDVRELVGSAEFQAWFAAFTAARKALAEADQARDEALAQLTVMEFRAELTQKNAIDTLYRGGEHEDLAARLLADAEAAENKSFPGVAAFEEQRFKVSELWYRLGALEKAVEEARDGKKAAWEIEALEKKQKLATEEYTREMGRRDRLWDEVERLWMQGAEASLLTAEQKVLARKVRRTSEQLFALAEDRKKKALSLKAAAEAAATALEAARAKLEATRTRARELFGAAVGEDFLYFRHRDDQRHAYAVALVEDSENYNIEVKPLVVYSVERQRGVGFLEPARVMGTSMEEGDRRFEEYFLRGRKGEVRPVAAS